jgi:hypothetical protein
MNMLGVPKYTVNKVHEKIYSISVQRERERESVGRVGPRLGAGWLDCGEERDIQDRTTGEGCLHFAASNAVVVGASTVAIASSFWGCSR